MVLYTEMINKKNWGQLDRRAKQCVPEQLNIKLKYANQQNKCYPCKIKKLTEKKKNNQKTHWSCCIILDVLLINYQLVRNPSFN